MIDNSKKVILDLCGGTGSWSRPYRDAGYDVRVITMPMFDVLKWREYPEIMEALTGKQVYGILAAPPCTMFSRARTTASTPRDFIGAMAIVRACMEIIWYARSEGSLEFWALENPMGMLRQFLGNPGWSFRGWEFGDKHVKFTDVWGYFKKPAKKRGIKPITFGRAKWANPKKPAEYGGIRLSRADVRAITPPLFAKAFYKANQ